MTLKEEIKDLANVGFKATVDCFTQIVFDTYGEVFTSREVEFGSASRCINTLRASMELIKKDVRGAQNARDLICKIYPEEIGPPRNRNINIPRQVLLSLVTLAEKYQRLVLAIILEASMDELKAKIIELEGAYNKAVTLPAGWPQKLSSALKFLYKNNHIQDIKALVFGEQAPLKVTAETETQIVELPRARKRAG